MCIPKFSIKLHVINEKRMHTQVDYDDIIDAWHTDSFFRDAGHVKISKEELQVFFEERSHSLSHIVGNIFHRLISFCIGDTAELSIFNKIHCSLQVPLIGSIVAFCLVCGLLMIVTSIR